MFSLSPHEGNKLEKENMSFSCSLDSSFSGQQRLLDEVERGRRCQVARTSETKSDSSQTQVSLINDDAGSANVCKSYCALYVGIMNNRRLETL